MTKKKRGESPVSRQRESRRIVEFPTTGAELAGHIEHFTELLNSRRERYEKTRVRVRLRKKIGELLEEMAANMNYPHQGRRLLEAHHPDNWGGPGGHLCHDIMETYVKAGKKGELPEWEWIEKAEKYLDDDQLATLLDPELYTSSRARALESLRSKRAAIRRLRDKEADDIAEMWDQHRFPAYTCVFCGESDCYVWCGPKLCGDPQCDGVCDVCSG